MKFNLRDETKYLPRYEKVVKTLHFVNSFNFFRKTKHIKLVYRIPN